MMKIFFITTILTFALQCQSKCLSPVSFLRDITFNAQQADDSLAVILGIIDTDKITVDNVREKLAGVNGVKFICYDNRLGVFVVSGAHTDYNSKTEVFNACQKAVGSTRLYLKTGSAREIVSQCPFSGLNDPDTMKSFLNN